MRAAVTRCRIGWRHALIPHLLVSVVAFTIMNRVITLPTVLPRGIRRACEGVAADTLLGKVIEFVSFVAVARQEQG